MWKTIYVNAHLYKDYSFFKRTRNKVTGGKASFTDVKYENIPLYIAKPQISLSQDQGGHKVNAMATILMPIRFFKLNGISPSLDDYITKDNIKYRIVSIQEIDEIRHFDIYNLAVRREEIAYRG